MGGVRKLGKPNHPRPNIKPVPTTARKSMNTPTLNGHRTAPSRLQIADNIDMFLLKKAIFFSNNTLQLEKISYTEMILYNQHDEVVYFYPKTGESLMYMDPILSVACGIVYTAVNMGYNLTKDNMITLNNAYKKLRELHGT